MGVTEEQQKTAHSFIVDFYQFMKDFYNPEEQNKYWDEMILRSKEISEKYDDKVFDALIVTFMTEMEKKADGR